MSNQKIGNLQAIAQFLSNASKSLSGTIADIISPARMVIFGTLLTTLNKPMFAASGYVFATFGTTATLYWITAGKVFDRMSKGIREAPSKALIGDLSQQSGDSPTAAFSLRQALGTFGALVGSAIAGIAFNLSGRNYILTFALSAIPAAAALLITTAAFGNKSATAEAKEKSKAVAVAEGETGQNKKLSFLEKAKALKGAVGPAYWEALVVVCLLYFARFDASFITLRAKTVMAKSQLPLLTSTMMLTTTLLAAPAGIRAKSSLKARNNVLLLGFLAMIGADLAFALIGSVPGMFLGATLVGVHMALTHGVSLAMVSSYIPTTSVPGIGRITGTCWSFTDFVFGIILAYSNSVAGKFADITVQQGRGNIGCFFGGIGATVLSGLALIIFAKFFHLGKEDYVQSSGKPSKKAVQSFIEFFKFFTWSYPTILGPLCVLSSRVIWLAPLHNCYHRHLLGPRVCRPFVYPTERRLGNRPAAGICQFVRAAAMTAGTDAPAKAFASPSNETSNMYKKLQNGSDVRGIAITGVEGENVNLPPTAAFNIGCGFAEWLSKRLGKSVNDLKISVGQDPRLSGPLLSSAIVAGLASRGAQVVQFGLATTPAMYMSCILEGHVNDGAIMITASHLPFNRNGFKFFTKEGGLEKKDITEVLQQAAASASAQMGEGQQQSYSDAAHVLQTALRVDPGRVPEANFMPVYSAHMQKLLKEGVNHPDHYDTPLKGFHFLVDAGNGGGGFFATDVLAPLGADITGSQFLDPDGMFPNHIPNPEDKRAMQSATEAVKRHSPDLAIVFDTDVDRSAVVASDGEPINSNRYIALMAAVTLRKYPGTTIVTDSVTSNGLTQFIKDQGGKHFRYKRGYKNVISKGIELNDQGEETNLMMETSGHGAMKENYFLDDGAYSALQIIIETAKQRVEGGKSITADLLGKLHEPLEASEFRLKLQTEDFKSEGDHILHGFHEWVKAGADGASGWALEKENFEGYRVNVDEGEGKQGWLLLRASLHDPLLVLNVESDTTGGMRGIVDKVSSFFGASDYKVDSSQLEDLH
ncbi:hypothetical protein WJX84_005290 [Apatococcus fuscideae]|uniref:phosphoglucomutase (alpha-D-glucose-1,6-bisphosphate-dependent) n=1 Tax=Apatococcus fuscideae TaxID=2026836 RepID=A0AAW1SM23_9CHLO